ncbi:Alpha/beta hydrolase fold-1 [Gautieria morchelliformis]|nr:Alpha/beta hydrolase fold-1 [Gautieria morchelliformis]
MVLVSERFVIPVRGHDGCQKLFTSVKRYTPQSTSRPLCGGTTLLLTHGVTFHKELWEPTLAHIFKLQSRSNGPNCLREAWAIDAPNHGESAALNDFILNVGSLITFREYAHAITAFLASGLLDMSTHRIVGIGHSAGTAPLIWAADDWYRRANKFPFHSLILLEPPLMSAALDSKYGKFNEALAAKARRRRTRWPSREEATLWFRQQQKKWDPRCSALFAEYGLRRAQGTSREVALSCPGQQEAACYSVSEQDEVLALLVRLCSLIPVHTIFGEFVDLSPHPEIQDNIVDHRQGRRMASVTRMPGLGPMILGTI